MGATSFNLMKSLNENALPEIKQTKRLREAMENITEGAGAGYHIIGTVENSHVNSFNVVETTEDEYGIPTYIIDCDIDATLEDVSFESYEYGGKVDSASIHITKLYLIDNHEPEEKGELNDTNIEQSLNQTMIKSLIGGGYVHQTFTGEIEFDDDNATGSSYTDFYVEGVGYNFVDSDLINYIDLSVQGENTTTEYIVYSEDYSELDRFESEEEATEYAKNNPEAYRVEELSYVYDFGGDIDPNSEYSETVWEKDDFEESEHIEVSKKLNEKALIENTSSNEDFIQQCKDSGQYKKYHMGLIKRMLASGLTPNQVKQFVNPQFNYQQFIEIADGFKEGLTMDQIKLYANLKYCGGQMEEIKLGFINGLTLEQIKVYADPKYDECQMCEIEQGFIEGLTMEQVGIYANPKFDDTQMRQIREGFKEGLTMEQVGIYANPKFDNYQMEEIKEGLQNGMTLEQINLYADPKFDSTQMEQIKYGFEDGLTMEQVMVYANPQYDWYQMHAIREGFEDGLTIEQVKTYADPKYDDFEMDAIREELVDKKLNEKKETIGDLLEEKLNSNEIIVFSKKVLDAQTDEDLKQIVDEIKYYSEPTYTRCMEIVNGGGSTQYKAGQISDILYQLNESNMEEVRAKSAEKGLLEPEAVNEEVIPNSFNMRCPKCGSPNYLEVDDEELEDGTQRYHLVCQDCGYTEKDEFNPLDEAEEQEKSYTITIGYAGFIGVEEDYEVYASSKEEAIDYALENAKEDLEVTSIEKDDEDEYIVYVSFATYMGTDQDYYITADDEGEAEELALEEAASSLEVISINGVNIEDLDESEELIEEEIVSDKLTEVKSQGNVFMLQDNEKYIVGIDYNKDENIINDAEIYNDKDEADKDYFSRCDITLNGEQVDPTEQNLGIDEKITEEA